VTSLNHLRTAYKPQLAASFSSLSPIFFEETEKTVSISGQIAPLFPFLKSSSKLVLSHNTLSSPRPLRVGVVFSGGQAPGGHNVIAGLYDALKAAHQDSQLIGFLDGPSGVLNAKTLLITEEILASYRNMGGFDLIGSGRTKIESEEDKRKAQETIVALNLQGLVIIGGDDSNTNAAVLAEHFLANNVPCSVVGVPKTIDGDLKGHGIETSFGFDTATKTYSATIGSIARDALSAKKYYFFIRLMGRSASHITLECALQTRPNFVLIGEEIAEEKRSLQQIVSQLADMVAKRAEDGKNYGVILIPEGTIEFIPEVRLLIQELNKILAKKTSDDTDSIEKALPEHLRSLYQLLPASMQKQLILERDPHGNVQVSKIETERLLIELVDKELKEREKSGKYNGHFSAVPLFLGYEGRSCLPSNFDANYCYNLGFVSFLLIQSNKTGYMACMQNLKAPPTEWIPTAIPIVEMLTLEVRKGKEKAVIKKALVDLNSTLFHSFKTLSKKWEGEDSYLYPTPIQFFGSEEITDSIPETLRLA
jgi:pyrophosphate--fructose-6-phosphate 1-phosphotransferase